MPVQSDQWDQSVRLVPQPLNLRLSDQLVRLALQRWRQVPLALSGQPQWSWPLWGLSDRLARLDPWVPLGQ